MPDTNTAQTTIFKGDNLLGIAKQAIFKHTVFREGRPPGTWIGYTRKLPSGLWTCPSLSR